MIAAKQHVKPPERLVRAMAADVDVDVEQRILRRAMFMTRSLANDGGIVVPAGLSVRHFQENPVVLAMHGRTEQFPVVGRSLALRTVPLGMESETQFADTELGREIAYLYGVNERKEVYARAWSFGWDSTQVETWTLDRAKDWLGQDWDEELVPPAAKRWDEVWVATKSVLNEYSAVAVGADRKALSRAHTEQGIRLAGELVAEIDLGEASRKLAELERTQGLAEERILRLERDIQALRSDGASAAARRDSEAIAAELRELCAVAQGRN